ncbi:hypothetical protein ABDK96_15770 [Citricoccus nitrophenolicus]|uniref:Uncharacterized protein n=1 Tax=Citricoccus nitrophenolicus TaxID=863575 RepID=A0ABV0ILW2_9MICC
MPEPVGHGPWDDRAQPLSDMAQVVLDGLDHLSTTTAKESVLMDDIVPNLLLTALGGVIGIVGSLATAVFQNRTTERNQRRDLASRFLRQAEMIGAQIIREARRGDELDLPINPGWDLPLIAEREEIALRLGSDAEQAAQKVIGALEEMLTGTVGSMMRFDEATDEFRAIYWKAAGRRRKAESEPKEESRVLSGEDITEKGT